MKLEDNRPFDKLMESLEKGLHSIDKGDTQWETKAGKKTKTRSTNRRPLNRQKI